MATTRPLDADNGNDASDKDRDREEEGERGFGGTSGTPDRPVEGLQPGRHPSARPANRSESLDQPLGPQVRVRRDDLAAFPGELRGKDI